MLRRASSLSGAIMFTSNEFVLVVYDTIVRLLPAGDPQNNFLLSLKEINLGPDNQSSGDGVGLAMLGAREMKALRDALTEAIEWDEGRNQSS